MQRADQRLVDIAIKLSPVLTDADAAHLRWLQQGLGDDLLDAVFITSGTNANRRPEGVAVVPASLL